MKYKKLLAATAMTSAAFVVPVMVGAEEIAPEVKPELIADGTYLVGDTVKAALTEIKTPAGDGTTTETVDKIVSYEWFIGDATTASSQTAEFKLPMHAEGKKVKLVVTTEGKEKYFEEIPVKALDTLTADVDVEGKIVTKAKINSTITMKNLKLPEPDPIPNPDEDEVISGYEWYLVDGNQYKLLVGENGVDLEIPIDYSGKKVLFVVKTESGKAYKKEVEIGKLEVVLSDVEYSIKVNGEKMNLPITTDLLPGDQIEIVHSEVKGKGEALLKPEDYEVHYKWVAYNIVNDIEGSQFALPNVTGNTFTIPVDSEKQGYAGFRVTVKISVPSIIPLTEDSRIISIGTSSKSAEGLITAIDGLRTKSDSNPAPTFKELQEEVNRLLTAYNQLNASAKATITNYAKLDEYVQGFKVVDPLTKDFEKVYTNFKPDGNLTVKQAELLKAVNSLRQSYNNLTAEQKKIYQLFEQDNSHPTIAQLHEWVVKINDNDKYVTNKAVNDFNNKVTTNIDTAVVVDGKYNPNLITAEPDNLKTLTAFEATIKQYLDEAKTFDRAYQPLLNTELLQTALADVKKARAVIDKIDKISTQTGKKKASAIIAAEKAYNKLNIAQSSLISNSTLDKLLKPFSQQELDEQKTANQPAESLVTDINAILPAGAEMKYPFDSALLETKLTDIAAKYKLLTSDQKKLVTNYKSIGQVKRDVSAAKRVATSIVKANEAKILADEYANDEDNKKKYISKMKSALSKYNSAYKAFTKLTIEQKSLVNGDSLKSAIASVTEEIYKLEFPENGEYGSGESSKVVEVIKEIADILNTAEDTALAIGNSAENTDEKLQLAIENAKLAYKALDSSEKKLVHNYGLVSTASSHLSKASSVKKRLLAATDERKFASAKKSFDKLQPVQQGLIIGTYTDISQKYTSSGSSNLQELDEKLKEFFEPTNDPKNYNIEKFKELQKQLQSYSSTELKSLSNSKEYQSMLNDVKKVDSFVTKMVKLGENPTYSQKDSIYKSYLKLTQVQQQLLGTYKTPDAIVDEDTYSKKIFEWMEAAEGASTDLNSRIGAIIVNGKYVESLDGISKVKTLADFKQQLDNLTKEYKALDSKERKLVVNYSYIKDAEKDLKAVRAVIQLEEQLEKAEDQSPIEQAKNRLTVEQKSLYDLVTPVQQP